MKLKLEEFEKKEIENETETQISKLDFDKFYSRLAIIHDKELYLALNSKESYFLLLQKCYNEIKSITMLNYNRRLAFSIQISSLRLAIKSKKYYKT